MKKHIALVICAAILFSLFAGCAASATTVSPSAEQSAASASASGDPAPATSEGGKKKVVAYAIPGLLASIWSAAADGFKTQAEEYGWEAVIIDPNDNLENQITMIQNQITKGVDALAITSIDGEAVGPLMGECAKANIPVFAIDRKVTGTSVATIEADNYKIGQEMANLYLEYLGDKQGKVLFVGGPLNNSPTVARVEGFSSVVEPLKNVEIVGTSTTEFDNELALANILNYLQANPDINCIYTCTDTLLPAIMTALEETNRLVKKGEEGHIFVGSVDGDSYGIEKVTEGYCDATYNLDPYEWAAVAVRNMKAYFDGEKVEESLLVPGAILTAENYEELKASGKLWGLG